jgi:hypothetical protein
MVFDVVPVPDTSPFVNTLVTPSLYVFDITQFIQFTTTMRHVLAQARNYPLGISGATLPQ